MHMASCYMSLLVGSCWIVMTFSDELKNELRDINENGKVNDKKLMEKLSKFVEFHTETIQLS